MPNLTPNYNLVKPLVTEQYDIAKVTNENADIIDDALHDLNIGKQGLPTVEKVTPVDADMVILLDSADSDTPKKWSWLNIKASLKTYFDNIYQTILVSGTNIKTINGNSVLGSGNLVIESGDWKSISATLTYASADSPTFVANTSVDLTSVISIGMKIKLTQTTVKYFFVTAITSTTITLYGGTDYTLANASITLPYFSSMKAPFGFPLNPDKWSVTITDTTRRSQATPTSDVWYNVGSLGITVPIGLWDIGYKANVYASKGTPSFKTVVITLSETNNGNTLAQFKCAAYVYSTDQSNSLQVGVYNILNLTIKTQFYMNISTNQVTDLIAVDGGFATTVIKAVCAYL